MQGAGQVEARDVVVVHHAKHATADERFRHCAHGSAVERRSAVVAHHEEVVGWHDDRPKRGEITLSRCMRDGPQMLHSRAVPAALEPLGLTHPQYLVMLALWERSPRSLRDIADALLLEPPTLTPLLKRLEAIGYLERRRNPANERELGIELTAAGRALRARAEQVPVQVAQQLALPREFLEEVRGALDVLVRASLAVGAKADAPVA